jgi:hypothetical protein
MEPKIAVAGASYLSKVMTKGEEHPKIVLDPMSG